MGSVRLNSALEIQWWWTPIESQIAKTKVWSWEAEGPRCGLHFSSNDRWEVRIAHWTEWWGQGHRCHDYHLQYNSDWCSQLGTWEGTPQVKAMGHQRCSRPLWWEERFEEAVWSKKEKEYREANKRIQKAVKKAKEDWICALCEEIETCLIKNNSKRAYQLVKELTSEKQGRSSTIQDKTGKCLTEDNEILSR